MQVSESTIVEEVTALAPREVVWKVLTTPSTWPKWWGGAIQRVEPTWQEGASVHWQLGTPSRIEKCIPARRSWHWSVILAPGHRFIWKIRQ